jgi:hypothetical protein
LKAGNAALKGQSCPTKEMTVNLTDKGFRDGLNQQLRDAGYSEQEIKIGALVSEFYAGLQLLKSIARMQDAPMVGMPAGLLTTTFAELFQEVVDAAKLDADRVIAAAKIIGDACMGKAKEVYRQMQNQSAPAVGAMAADAIARGLDTAGPVDPSQVN